MKITKYILAGILFLNAVNIKAQTNFSDWDRDGNNIIEKEEFTDKFQTEFYSAFAKKSDTRGILEEGFFEQSFAGLDTDNDNFISDEEWLISYNYFYKDYLDNGEIASLDLNKNNKLEYDEYYKAVNNSNYFNNIDLDADNYISEYEMAENAFNNWEKLQK